MVANDGLLPLAVSLEGRRCVVVGGGSIAARRVPQLIAAGGRVTVIAPRLHDDLMRYARSGAIVVCARCFQEGDLRGASFILAATGQAAVDEQVAREAGAAGSLVCVAGDSTLGNTHFMAVLRRGPLVIGLHTGGAAPAVSAALRRRVEAALSPDVEDFLERVGALRARLKQEVSDAGERGRRWQRVAASGIIDAVLAGEVDVDSGATRIAHLLDHDTAC